MNDSPLMKANTYLELSLTECGKEQCIPEKNFSFSVKNYHLFHYIVSGQGTFVLNNVEYQLREGMMFYIPPHCQPVYYPNHENPWTYIWLGVNGSNANSYLDLINCNIKNPIIIDKEKVLHPYFEKIYSNYRLNGFLDIKCLGLAYEMFSELFHIKEKKHDIKKISSKESYIKVAKEYILNNFEFDISIDDIAKNVGVTSNYLANIFTEIEKKSPKRYLTETRMNKAILLLESNRYKIKEVGEMVGYKNQLHFSSEFKKFYGISPLKYAENHKNVDVNNGGNDNE